MSGEKFEPRIELLKPKMMNQKQTRMDAGLIGLVAILMIAFAIGANSQDDEKAERCAKLKQELSGLSSKMTSLDDLLNVMTDEHQTEIAKQFATECGTDLLKDIKKHEEENHVETHEESTNADGSEYQKSHSTQSESVSFEESTDEVEDEAHPDEEEPAEEEHLEEEHHEEEHIEEEHHEEEHHEGEQPEEEHPDEAEHEDDEEPVAENPEEDDEESENPQHTDKAEEHKEEQPEPNEVAQIELQHAKEREQHLLEVMRNLKEKVDQLESAGKHDKKELLDLTAAIKLFRKKLPITENTKDRCKRIALFTAQPSFPSTTVKTIARMDLKVIDLKAASNNRLRDFAHNLRDSIKLNPSGAKQDFLLSVEQCLKRGDQNDEGSDFPSMKKFKIPKIEIPRFEMPQIEVPKIEMPRVEVPRKSPEAGHRFPEMPRMPKFEMPKIPEIPDIPEIPEIPSMLDNDDAMHAHKFESPEFVTVTEQTPDGIKISKTRKWSTSNKGSFSMPDFHNDPLSDV